MRCERSVADRALGGLDASDAARLGPIHLLGELTCASVFHVAERRRVGGLGPTMTVVARLANLPSVQTRRG